MLYYIHKDNMFYPLLHKTDIGKVFWQVNIVIKYAGYEFPNRLINTENLSLS